MNVQRYNFCFKGINCSVWIKALVAERYEILIRSDKPLTEQDKKALKMYLLEEGYIYSEDINFD